MTETELDSLITKKNNLILDIQQTKSQIIFLTFEAAHAEEKIGDTLATQGKEQDAIVNYISAAYLFGDVNASNLAFAVCAKAAACHSKLRQNLDSKKDTCEKIWKEIHKALQKCL